MWMMAAMRNRTIKTAAMGVSTSLVGVRPTPAYLGG